MLFENDNFIHYKSFVGTENSYIAKHSFNIIDIIEVGDYVNGVYVRATYLEGENHYIKLEGLEHTRVYENDIKNIVTKELFNSIKYEVK